MPELFESNTDVCLIPAASAKNDNLSLVLLPVLCSQANAGGGSIVIGAERAADDSVILEGLTSISKIQLFIEELVSDKSKISVNTIKTIRKIKERGKDLIKIEVAPAPWTARPVYINGDPANGVYSYSEGERAVSGKNNITLMAQDSIGAQNDNERLEYFSEFFIDFVAIERYKKHHRAKHPFPKWDLLDNESYMERIGAKSDGRLLKAGALMFGANDNVSFCLRRINNGEEERVESENIWSFIELLLPIFDNCIDIECKNALLEAFFNSLIHADYNNGKVEAVEEDDKFTFINSGIPRSRDNSSVCRNLRIMKMLCFVGYANNKGAGMEAINKYSKGIKLSVNYEKWLTEISIPVPVNAFTKPLPVESEEIETEAIEPENLEPEKSIIPSVFYPVAKLVKLAELSEEQEIISSVSYSDDTVDYQDTASPYQIETETEGYVQIDAGIEEEEALIRAEETEEIEPLKAAFEIFQNDVLINLLEAGETEELSELEAIEETAVEAAAVFDDTEETEEIITIEATPDIAPGEAATGVTEAEETEELSELEAIEETVVEAAAVFDETEETEEIVTIEAAPDIAPGDAATSMTEAVEAEETTELEAIEETVVEAATVFDETGETEEIVTIEAAPDIAPGEAETSVTEAVEAEEIIELEAIEETVVEAAAVFDETEEIITIEASEEIIQDETMPGLDETEESWEHLQDPENRKILEQIIKEYLESSNRDEAKRGIIGINEEAGIDDEAKVISNFKDINLTSMPRLTESDEDSIKNEVSDDYPDAVMIVRENLYASSDMIKDALFDYCSKGFRTIGEISRALLRPESSIKRGINRMIREGTLIENENNAYRSIPGVIGDV